MEDIYPSINSVLCLGTNASSNSLNTHVKGLIAEAEATISRIDSQMRDLVCERERQRANIAAWRITLAPVRQLPAELLSEIFLFTFNPFNGARRDVLRLSHVCAFWRQVAHTTPQLWTTLRLDVRHDRTVQANSMACIQAWLARSSPLTVSIRLHCRITGVDIFLSTMAPSMNRWETFELVTNDISGLGRISPEPTEMLTTLSLQTTQSTALTIYTFAKASRLREVTLDVFDLSQIVLPWSQLTHLDVSTKSADSCLQVLLKCANLVSATFSTTLWEENVAVPLRPPTVLPHLITLKLNFMEGHSGPFFQPLALPELKLHLDFIADAGWDEAIFSEFLRRSPNLETFSSCHLPMNSEEFFF